MKLMIELPDNIYKELSETAVIVTDIYPATVEKALTEAKPICQGRWILVHPLQEDDGGAYMCSCCRSGSYEVNPATWKACPWCAALMEVDE